MSGKTQFKTLLIFIYLAVLIVSGNTLTFNLFGRVSVKLSELISLLLGAVLIREIISLKLDGVLGLLLAWAALALALVAVNVFRYGFTAGDALTGVLYLARFVYSVVLCYAVFYYLKVNKLLSSALVAVNVLYIVVCFIGFFQLIFFPVAYDFYSIFWNIGTYFPNADPHVDRLISTYFDPNYLSSCLLIGFTVNSFLFMREVKSDGWLTLKKAVYAAFFAIYLLTILLTDSRSGMLGAALVVLFMLLFGINYSNVKLWQIVLPLLIVVALGFLLFFSDIDVFVRIRNVFEDASAGARFDTWRKGAEIALDTQFLGIGYNLFGAYNDMFYGVGELANSYGNDSSLLLTLITTGILGLVLYVAHIGLLFKVAKNSATRALIIAALVISNFNNLLYYPLWVFMFYFAVLAIDAAEEERKTAEQLSAGIAAGAVRGI